MLLNVMSKPQYYLETFPLHIILKKINFRLICINKNERVFGQWGRIMASCKKNT